MTTLIKKKQIDCFRVDEATTINRFGFATDEYDVVEIFVNGTHGTMKNKRSNKTYYIASGIGTFTVDNVKYEVEAGDIISVRSDTWLSIQGQNLRALIITSPPFNNKDEEWK